VFFYCESDRPDELNGSYILSSLIKQLCEYLRAKNRGCPDDVADVLIRFFGKKRVVPDFDDLKGVFILLFDLIPNTVYIIDGLDALHPDQSKDLFEFFRFMFCGSGSPPKSRILIFSREQLPGYTGIPLFMASIRRISTTSNVMPDLHTYIDTSVTDKLMSQKLTDNLALLDEVKRVLLEESSGMYESNLQLPSSYLLKANDSGFFGSICSWRFCGKTVSPTMISDRRCEISQQIWRRHTAAASEELTLPILMRCESSIG
jgi:hypothetical protein